METSNLSCEYCNATVEELATKCPSCGFPVGGTDLQKEIFYHQIEAKKGSLKNLRNQIYNARVTLWIIAGLSFLYAIIILFSNATDSTGLILVGVLNAVIAIIFLLLASYASERPFTALIIATAIYLALFVYGVIEWAATSLVGILSRLVIVGFLVKGAFSARDAEELKKELERKTK